VRKQSTQVPCSVCSWNSFSSRVRSEDAAHHLQRVLLVGQQQPRRGDTEQLDTPLGQHTQEVDHIEVVDESVGHLHEHVG
jgi:hypothetical protein